MDDLLLSEYQMLMKAHALKQVDKEYEMHLQAWLNQRAKDTKQKGKKTVPVFRKFDEFFNYKEREQQILGTDKKEERSTLRNLLSQANR